MKEQLELNVITEQNMSLIARLLLILNKKQLTLNAMNVDTNYSTGFYKYNLNLSGNSNLLKQAVKVIAKQIGVFDVKTNEKNIIASKKEKVVLA